jgi:ubiquinone/menaquinone biosynthesis C-methylase UbiE
MRGSERRPRLLPQADLIKTGEIDHADWNFRPFLGGIQRKRFQLAVSVLRRYRLQSLLEIGYGSGVFMPELNSHCAELYGLDTHCHPREVAAALARHGIVPRLFTGSVTAMPFPDASFDGIVAISALEFVDDLELACQEINRVMKGDGLFLTVTPGRSFLVDLGLKLLTGKSAQADFADRRQRILPTLKKHFELVRQQTVPRFGTTLLHLYTALELKARKDSR